MKKYRTPHLISPTSESETIGLRVIHISIGLQYGASYYQIGLSIGRFGYADGLK